MPSTLPTQQPLGTLLLERALINAQDVEKALAFQSQFNSLVFQNGDHVLRFMESFERQLGTFLISEPLP